MKNHKRYITNDIGATRSLLHPSCFRKKAGSTGCFPQGAQSAKKGPGATGITTPNPVTDINRNWCNLKTRAGYGFQLSTGLFSTLPAWRAGTGLWLAGQQKPLKKVKNRTENPASEMQYGLTDNIGASRNAPFVQRDESGYSGITTSGSASQRKRGTGKNPDHPSDFISTGLFSALPTRGRAGARPRTRTPLSPQPNPPFRGQGARDQWVGSNGKKGGPMNK